MGKVAQRFGLGFVDRELELAEPAATNSQSFLSPQLGSREYQLSLVSFGLPSMDISSLLPGQHKYLNIGVMLNSFVLLLFPHRNDSVIFKMYFIYFFLFLFNGHGC